MVKSADTADLKSAALNRAWGFKSPSGHHNDAGITSGTSSPICLGFAAGGESYPDPGYTIYVTTQLIYVGTTVVQISTYDQTPIIYSVSPPVIPDGTTSTVVVAGAHFGAFPSLNFPDTAGMSISYSSRSDTSITAQITPNGQEGTHAVEVVSTGFGGSGFLSANGTTSESPASTLTVAGSPCTWQIVAEQTLYHINSGSNYKTATIPISVSTTPNASCPGAGTVNWTVTTVYATSAHKGASQAPQHQFTSSLNQTYNYTTSAGEGGQLTFKASFSSNGATLSKSKTVLVDGTGIPVASVKSLLTADYSAGAGGTPNLFRGVACTESNSSNLVPLRCSLTVQRLFRWFFTESTPAGRTKALAADPISALAW